MAVYGIPPIFTLIFRCDMKGWMTDNPRAQNLKFATKSVPLIVSYTFVFSFQKRAVFVLFSVSPENKVFE